MRRGHFIRPGSGTALAAARQGLNVALGRFRPHPSILGAWASSATTSANTTDRGLLAASSAASDLHPNWVGERSRTCFSLERAGSWPITTGSSSTDATSDCHFRSDLSSAPAFSGRIAPPPRSVQLPLSDLGLHAQSRGPLWTVDQPSGIPVQVECATRRGLPRWPLVPSGATDRPGSCFLPTRCRRRRQGSHVRFGWGLRVRTAGVR
jgi:hypothetical protein